MSKSILFPVHQLVFPPSCVICLASASRKYPIQQVFTHGRTSRTISVDVPMCDAHFAVASHKSPAERVLEWLGVGVGILAGITGGILLFTRWVGSGGLFLKILLGTLAGLGFFVLVWWLIAVVIAPYLADPESKQVRSAVKITRYLPGEQLVQLEFANEQMASLVEKANAVV